MNEPFGRQPKPVKFTLEGETEDIDYWFKVISNLVDDIQREHRNIFTVHPRAVND